MSAILLAQRTISLRRQLPCLAHAAPGREWLKTVGGSGFQPLNPSLPGSGSSFTGTRYCSSAQAPRSISLQRSLQNGRNLFAAVHSTSAAQVGQATRAAIYRLQNVSSNGTFTSAWCARVRAAHSLPGVVKRTISAYLLALISGVKAMSLVRRMRTS